jgi:hypothetical protein
MFGAIFSESRGRWLSCWLCGLAVVLLAFAAVLGGRTIVPLDIEPAGWRERTWGHRAGWLAARGGRKFG